MLTNHKLSKIVTVFCLLLQLADTQSFCLPLLKCLYPIGIQTVTLKEISLT